MVKTKSTPKRKKAGGARNVKASVEMVVSDAALNDSDKTFVVPAGQEWEIEKIFAQLVTDATVGNRIVQLQILDASDNILYVIRTAVTQAASLTRRYQWGGDVRETAFVNDTLNLPFVPQFLLAGQKIRVFDEANIAAATDDLTVRIMAQVFRY